LTNQAQERGWISQQTFSANLAAAFLTNSIGAIEQAILRIID